MSSDEEIDFDLLSSDNDSYQSDDFQAERGAYDRTGLEDDDPKTFQGAVKIAGKNLSEYIPGTELITNKIIIAAEKYIPNWEVKNANACILSYMCIKNNKINTEMFSKISIVIEKNKHFNIKKEDLIRYCRMWIKYNKS